MIGGDCDKKVTEFERGPIPNLTGGTLPVVTPPGDVATGGDRHPTTPLLDAWHGPCGIAASAHIGPTPPTSRR